MDSKQVISIVMNDVSSCLSNSVSSVRSALVAGNFGKTHVTKDFLRPNSASTSLTISRGLNNWRRKCDVVFVEKVPKHIVEQLKEGLLLEKLSYLKLIF